MQHVFTCTHIEFHRPYICMRHNYIDPYNRLNLVMHCVDWLTRLKILVYIANSIK